MAERVAPLQLKDAVCERKLLEQIKCYRGDSVAIQECMNVGNWFRELIAALDCAVRVRNLSFAGTVLRGRPVAQLFVANRAFCLQSISLVRCSLLPPDIEAMLRAVLSSASLRSCDLSFNNASENSDILLEVAARSALKTFMLESCSLSGYFFEHLPRVLPGNRRLERLDIGGNPFPEGFELQDQRVNLRQLGYQARLQASLPRKH